MRGTYTMICKICGEEYLLEKENEGNICENCMVSIIRTDKIFPNEEDYP